MALLSTNPRPKVRREQTPRWRIESTVPQADEVPDVLAPKTAVLVGTTRKPKWLAFDCPCSTGHRIMLNLDASRWPCWRVRRKSPLSVNPSIDDANQGRRCHFFFEKGETLWARESEWRWHK